jgi:hypothetical protein
MDLLKPWPIDVAERRLVNKPRNRQTRTLADVAGKCLAETFSRQGFASVELVTHWDEIVGREIAANAEPIKIQWPRQTDSSAPGRATLVLRVQGPSALEIQHLSNVILERVNGFFGWRAIDRLALRQAPLQRAKRRGPPPAIDPQAARDVAATLTNIADDGLRDALGRLGAAIKRT